MLWLLLTGLILDGLGAALLFFGNPNPANPLDLQPSARWVIDEFNADHETGVTPFEEIAKRKYRLHRLGFALLMLGFATQAVGTAGQLAAA